MINGKLCLDNASFYSQMNLLLKGRDASEFVRKEEFQSFNSRVIQTPEDNNLTVESLPLSSGAGEEFKTTHRYIIASRHGEAIVSGIPGDSTRGRVTAQPTIVDIPFVHLDYDITPWVNNNTVDFTNSSVERAQGAVRRVRDKLDESAWSLVTDGFGTLGINEEFTGVSTGTADWSVSDAVVIFNDIVKFLSAIPKEFQTGDYRLHVNNIQFLEMNRVATNFPSSAMQLLAQSSLNITVVPNRRTVDGEALLYPFNPDVAYWKQHMSLRTVPWQIKTWLDTFKVVASGRAIVVFPQAGIKVTGI